VTVPDVLVVEVQVPMAAYLGSAEDALISTGPQGATARRGTWRVSVNWAAPVKVAGLPDRYRLYELERG
jgi:hypothetical protein